ncbi:MAG: orotidine-5'-phosphate decarboxylase [Sporomusaceae bacterium]|nr:orotidine-5'-phosphate decarboxylase [Sporomusaceae bacterium]
MNKQADIIVALDMKTVQEARRLVEDLGDSATIYKVGMELFYSAGAEAVQMARQAGKAVFLDLKLHDIPNTVSQAVTALARLGVSFISLHAAGGGVMLRQAANAAASAATAAGLARPKLLAITVLTSLGETEWKRLRFAASIGEQAVNLALLAKESGIDGVVASPQEAAAIRQACGEDFLIVTPGVRPAGSAVNDQSRIATPGGAVQAGADYLVIGRPITAAPDPVAAVGAIRQEMEGVV